MNRYIIISYKKLLSFSFFILLFLLLTNSSSAQLNSLKQLKENAKEINTLKESIRPSDPWTINHLITTNELAKELKNSKLKKPVILQVGFKFLYDNGHIPNAKFVGPASEKSGVNSIKNEVKSLKKNSSIVIYCGCCPWGDCPNIRPAYKTLKDMGYTNVKALYIPTNFVKNWADLGYPVSK